MTSSYRRQNKHYWNSGKPTKVSIYWSQQYNAYAIKWMDTFHFKEMTPIISYFRSKPYGDAVYDPDNRIWYFKEQYLADVRAMLAAFGPVTFEINFSEKQENHSFIGSPQVSISSLISEFKILTGEDIKDVEYTQAKKLYRRICMKMHPDIPGNDSTNLSRVNEIWNALERVHYNTKKEPTYNENNI